MPIHPARSLTEGFGKIRPLLAVGVLSLALVTGCSSGDEADNTSTSATAASTAGSSDSETSAPASDTSSSDEGSAEAPSSAATSGATGSEEGSSAAAPGGDPSASASASASAPAPSDESAAESEAAPDEAVEGTSCGGLSVAAVNDAIGGGTLESAIDVTVDAATGDSSCIFGTTTTIDTVVVDRAALATYLGGELAGLGDSEVLDSVAEVQGSAQTDVAAADSTVGGLTVRTLTGTDLTGTANALSVTVSDGNLVAVSATGPTLSESGLSETTLAVLELVLSS